MSAIATGETCTITEGYYQAIVTNQDIVRRGSYRITFANQTKEKRIGPGATQLTHIHHNKAVVLNTGEAKLSVANCSRQQNPYPDAFTLTIQDATVMVQKVFPYARFYRAQGYVDGAGSLLGLEAFFWNPKNTTVKIEFLRGEKLLFEAPALVFSKLELLHESPSSAWEIIELQFVTTNSAEAVRRLRQAGFTEPYTSITLDKPLRPEVLEARYTFTLPALRARVFVGVLSQDVWKEGAP